MIARISRRRFLVGATALGAGGLVAGTGLRGEAAPLVWRGWALGAEVELRLHGVTDQAMTGHVRAVRRALERVERAASLYRPDSELVRLNRTGVLGNPSADLSGLLRLAGSLHAATNGAFDPTVQPLFLALARSGGAPARAEFDLARAAIGWNRVSRNAGTIRLQSGMGLTLNGLAQGWAADAVTDVLRRRGLGRVLVDTGEISALGTPPGEDGWPVTIGDAGQRLILTEGRALAVSAPHGTNLDRAGLVGHILDPGHSGNPPPWSMVAVTATNAAVADGLSTALCLLDEEAQAKALARFPGASIAARTPA